MQSSLTSIEIMAETYRRTLDADAQQVRSKVHRSSSPSVRTSRAALTGVLIRISMRLVRRPHVAAHATA